MRTALVTLTICLLALPATAKYSGGTGEPNEPYQIATAADLIALGETPADYDKHFILTADIDLDPNLPGRRVFDKAVIAPDTNPSEWGFQGTPFSGVFDGNDRTITNLKVTVGVTDAGGGYFGFFGRIGSAATVSNLGLKAMWVSGRGPGHVGGLAGRNEGRIVRAYSNGWAGNAGHAGGLVGLNNGRIIASYSSASVSGFSAGGLVGASGGGSISSSYSSGSVSGNGTVGGFVGINNGSVATSYSNNSVSGNGTVGGFVGINNGSIVSSFWDTQTSGQTASAGGTGKSTPEMQTAKTFLDAGWDFVGETANGTEDIWWILEGKDYPRLWRAKYSGGGGTVDDPYRIATAADLITLGETPADYDKHFILTADIDLDPNLPGRKAFDKAVIAPDTVLDRQSSFQGTPFTGVFDGGGHIISHLTITGVSYSGLFGSLAPGAEIEDLGILDVKIIGSGRYIGGLVGWNRSGTVTDCYSTGTISGSSYVGGLVGSSYAKTVNQCYSTCTVSGSSYIGGLAGDNYAAVTQCYSTGAVSGTGSSYVGGLVGYNSGDVAHCFWDTQTSGQTTSAAGTGKTTVEMQAAATFLEAGWDFVGEIANGTEDIWWILEGKDYPRLWWELDD